MSKFSMSCKPNGTEIKKDRRKEKEKERDLNKEKEKEKERDRYLDVDLNEESNKYGLYFTRVFGIDDSKFNGDNYTIEISEILSSRFGTLKESCQFNFMVNLDWLVEQYAEEFRQCPLTLVFGDKPEYKIPLQECVASDPYLYNHIRLCPARLDIPYGTHHTKMMLLLYDEGLRVVVSTANLVPNDWHQKTQMVWISKMFIRRPIQSTKFPAPPLSKFQESLCTYLSTYRALAISRWVEIVKEHDCNPEHVHFIGSSPGRYVGEDMLKFGHMRLRQIFLKHFHHQAPSQSDPDHIIGQFSSIGSLGNTQNAWLCGEWLDSLRSQLDETFIASNQKCILDCLKLPPKSPVSLRLLYPTVNEVYESLEGVDAGDSLPHTMALAMKQPWFREFLHHWKSDHIGRTRAMPHVKTYVRLTPDESRCLWFLVTSANLSKAAWGCFEKQNTQFMIRSYEAGILILPEYQSSANRNQDLYSLYISGKIPREMKGIEKEIPIIKLPYDLPLVKYSKNDDPWVCDAKLKLDWCKRRLAEEENIQKTLELQTSYSIAARNLSAAIKQDRHPPETIYDVDDSFNDSTRRVRSPGQSTKFFHELLNRAKKISNHAQDVQDGDEDKQSSTTKEKKEIEYIDLT